MSSGVKKGSRGALSRKQSKKSPTDDLIVTDSEPDVADNHNHDSLFATPGSGPQFLSMSDLPPQFNLGSKSNPKSKHTTPHAVSSEEEEEEEEDDDDNDEDGGMNNNIALSASSDDDGLFGDENDLNNDDDDALCCHLFDYSAYKQLLHDKQRQTPLPPPPNQPSNAQPLSTSIPFPIVYPSTIFSMDSDAAYPINDFYEVQLEACLEHQKKQLRAEKYLQRTQKDHIHHWKRQFRQRQLELQTKRAEKSKIDALLGSKPSSTTTSSLFSEKQAGTTTTGFNTTTNTTNSSSTTPATQSPADPITSTDDEWISKDIFTYSPFTPSNFVSLSHDGPVILPQQEEQMIFFGKIFHYNTIAQMLGYSASSNLLTHGGKAVHIPSMRAPHSKHAANSVGNIPLTTSQPHSIHDQHPPSSDDEDQLSSTTTSAHQQNQPKPRGSKKSSSSIAASGLADAADDTTTTTPYSGPTATSQTKDGEFFPQNLDGSWTDPIDQTIINEQFVDKCIEAIEQKIKPTILPQTLAEIQAQTTFPELSHIQLEKIKQHVPAVYDQLLQTHREKCAKQTQSGDDAKTLDPDVLPMHPNPLAKGLVSKGVSFKPLTELWVMPELRYISFYFCHYNNINVKSREAAQTFHKLFDIVWFIGWNALRGKLRTIYNASYASHAKAQKNNPQQLPSHPQPPAPVVTTTTMSTITPTPTATTQTTMNDDIQTPKKPSRKLAAQTTPKITSKSVPAIANADTEGIVSQPRKRGPKPKAVAIPPSTTTTTTSIPAPHVVDHLSQLEVQNTALQHGQQADLAPSQPHHDKNDNELQSQDPNTNAVSNLTTMVVDELKKSNVNKKRKTIPTAASTTTTTTSQNDAQHDSDHDNTTSVNVPAVKRRGRQSAKKNIESTTTTTTTTADAENELVHLTTPIANGKKPHYKNNKSDNDDEFEIDALFSPATTTTITTAALSPSTTAHRGKSLQPSNVDISPSLFSDDDESDIFGHDKAIEPALSVSSSLSPTLISKDHHNDNQTNMNDGDGDLGDVLPTIVMFQCEHNVVHDDHKGCNNNNNNEDPVESVKNVPKNNPRDDHNDEHDDSDDDDDDDARLLQSVNRSLFRSRRGSIATPTHNHESPSHNPQPPSSPTLTTTSSKTTSTRGKRAARGTGRAAQQRRSAQPAPDKNDSSILNLELLSRDDIDDETQQPPQSTRSTSRGRGNNQSVQQAQPQQDSTAQQSKQQNSTEGGIIDLSHTQEMTSEPAAPRRSTRITKL